MRTITIIAILCTSPAFVVGCLLWVVVGTIATALCMGSGTVFAFGVMLPIALLGVSGMMESSMR